MEEYIYQAAKKGLKEVLAVEFWNHRESYLKVFRRVEAEFFDAELKNDHRSFKVVNAAMELGKAQKVLAQVWKEEDAGMYERCMAKRSQAEREEEMEKLFAVAVPKFEGTEAIKTYLRGQGDVGMLYPFLDQLRQLPGGNWMRRPLTLYDEKFHDEGFYRRCQTYMLLWHSSDTFFFFYNDFYNHANGMDGKLDGERIGKIFHGFDMEKVPISDQLDGVILFSDVRYEKMKQDFFSAAEKVFSVYLKERREETLAAFAGSEAVGRYFGLRVMRQTAGENKAEILKYSQDTAKMVRQELLDILCGEHGWEKEIKELLVAKKASDREIAVRVLSAWQGEGADYGEVLRQAQAKEKNAKVRELLGNAAAMVPKGQGNADGRVPSREELARELMKGNKKRSLAWAYATPFPAVHKEDGSLADEEYLQAVLLCYVSFREALDSDKNGGISRNAAFLAEGLDAAEFATYVGELFDRWVDAGAKAEKRWVLYAAAIHGDLAVVEKFLRQIQQWPQCARGTLACEAVRALSLNPLPQALFAVDGIALKSRFRQVRAAAAAAMDFAAELLKVSRKELEDRLVPDFGFDGNGERRFDYGTRAFVVGITPELELEVFEDAGADGALSGIGGDEVQAARVHGKRLKTMPAPGRRDDGEKAAASYEEFKWLKKQLKTVLADQKQRLEHALWSAREWNVEAWAQLFVGNPVMHVFAIGLVWGIYEDGKMLESFRYMGDGSWNTVEGDEYVLPASGKIRLVHPLELPEKMIAAWQEQFMDYEVMQPFEQLARTVYRIEEAEKGKKELKRFRGRVVNSRSFGAGLLGMGWYRGEAEDAGFFDLWYREDEDLGIGVELTFSGSYVDGADGDEDVTVFDVRFYQAGKGKTGRSAYVALEDAQIYALQDVPERYFSEIVRQLDGITAVTGRVHAGL